MGPSAAFLTSPDASAGLLGSQASLSDNGPVLGPRVLTRLREQKALPRSCREGEDLINQEREQALSVRCQVMSVLRSHQLSRRNRTGQSAVCGSG